MCDSYNKSTNFLSNIVNISEKVQTKYYQTRNQNNDLNANKCIN